MSTASTEPDPLTLLARAVDQAGVVVADVREDQLALPTPCRSWSVGQLLNHVVFDLSQFKVAAGGGRPDWSQPAPNVGPDRAGSFRSGAEELLAAWRAAGSLDGTIELPGLGTVPARTPVDQQIAEFAVHAWDLATATGQPIELDEQVAVTAIAWMTSALRPEFRGSEEEGHAFGPQVPVADDAPVYLRLAAFAGRDPYFTAA